ncbi:MAG TPA: metallophosphoesterase [Chloroflexota bacterium]|nr:metallophosphoesterase [Chloroflexota bacterium]
MTAPDETRPLRIAIVGDTHYTNPAYHRTIPPHQARNPTFAAGVERHVRTTRDVLPLLLADVRACQPDLVIQLGDVVQGHCDDDEGNERELREALELLQGIGRPLLFARGTHEGPNGGPADAVYRECYLSEIARTMGERRQNLDTSYAYETMGCRIIVLDYTTFVPHGPGDHLLQEQLAIAAHRRERVLVCGHPPLVPIARPFFSRLEYARTVLDRLADASVPADAYFCGHTHNQVVTLHRMGTPANGETDWWLPQFQSVPVGDPAQPPVLLADVRALLPPADTYQYGWGYLQGSCPGWFLVEVTAAEVRTRWRLLGPPGEQGDAGEVRWRAAGQPELHAISPARQRAVVPEWPLRLGDGRAQAVQLRAAGMGSRAPHRVLLNGSDVGTLGPLEHFNSQQALAVPEAAWNTIGARNELVVEPAAAEERCLGGFVLEVTLAGGSIVRSTPTPELYATAGTWDGWQWVTPGLRHVGGMETLRIPLCFR